MLSILFDHKKTGLPFVKIIFAVSCLIVSLPTLFFPGLYEIFDGYKPLNYPWQKFTLPFQHGFYAFPLLVHFGLNLILLTFCGVFSEKILGAARFLLLTIVPCSVVRLPTPFPGLTDMVLLASPGLIVQLFS